MKTGLIFVAILALSGCQLAPQRAPNPVTAFAGKKLALSGVAEFIRKQPRKCDKHPNKRTTC